MTVRRYTGVGASRTSTDCIAYARADQIATNDLVGDVRQDDVRLVILDADLIAGGYPTPILVNDRVVMRGQEHIVISANDATRRVAGVLVAHDVIVRGP